MTLLSDCGMAPMMIHLVPEVNPGALPQVRHGESVSPADESVLCADLWRTNDETAPLARRTPGALAQVRRSISFATGRVRPNGRRVACEFKLNCSGRRAACEFVCSPHGCLYKRSDENAFCL